MLEPKTITIEVIGTTRREVGGKEVYQPRVQVSSNVTEFEVASGQMLGYLLAAYEGLADEFLANHPKECVECPGYILHDSIKKDLLKTRTALGMIK